MNNSVIPRAQQVEVDLLKVLAGHEGDVERVVHGWVSLAAEIQKGVQSGSLDEPAMQTILVIASRISIFSKNYLQYQAEMEALASDFTSQLEEMFSNITLEDSSPAATSEPSSYTSSAPYIEPSYRWLLQNLHNPYPSKKTKESIACQTGCSAKDIDGWFVEARRKIGWNALRRSRFNNKRQSIVEAASRFFGKLDDVPPLTPALEVEFANVKSQAENLYCHQFSEQPSLLECGSHISDRCEPSRPRKRRRTPSQPSSSVATSSSLCRSDPSGRSSPESDSRLTDDISSDADSRASSMAPSQSSRSPSASYTDWLDDESPTPAHPFSTDSCNSVPPASSLKRERRLSLSDGSDTLKRPRTGCSGPRSHVVSDPLPLSSFSTSSTSLSPESLFDGTDLPPFLEIDLFNPSEFFGLENDALASSLQFSEPANQAVVTPTRWPLVQSQGKTVAASDLSYDPSVVSVVDNGGFEGQSPSSNGLPYLDITLDGLPGPLDWLTPFLDETTLNGLLEPNPIFQLDFPPIDDVLALDFSPPEVY